MGMTSTQLDPPLDVSALQARIAQLESELCASEARVRALLASTEHQQADATLQRYAREMAALYEVSLEINSQSNLTTLLSLIVEKAAGLLDAHMGGLYLMREDNQSLELVVSYHLPGNYVGTVLQLGEGLSGRVAQTGKPMMIADYQAWEGRAAAYSTDPFRRILGVPLKVGDKVLGVINITDDQKTGAFSEDDVRLASLFADQAAIAVMNARLYEAVLQELAEVMRAEQVQKALFRISEAAHTAQNLDELYVLIHNIVQDLMPARNFGIALYDATTDVLHFPYFIDASYKHGAPPPRRRGNGLIEYVLNTGEPLLGTTDDIIALINRENISPGGQPARSWLGVPLKWAERTFGVLIVQTYTESEPLTEEHLQILTFVSAQVVMAIQRKRAEQVQTTIYGISEAALAAKSLDDLYVSIHHIVSELIPAGNFYIALYDPATDAVSFPYFVDEMEQKPEATYLQRGRGLTEYVLHLGVPWLGTRAMIQDLIDRGVVEDVGPMAVDWLGVPLKAGDQLIGAIAVQSYSEHVRLTEEHKGILRFVSAQVAMAIQRRRVEEALQISEARLRVVLSNTPIMLLAFDRNGTVTFAEGKGLKVMKAVSEHLVGRSVYEMLPMTPLLLTGVERALAGEPVNIVIAIRGIAFELWLAPLLDAAGAPSGVISVAADVTERERAASALREAEEALRRAQKMESLGVLAGGIAHDFNNLLVALLGQTSLALAKLAAQHEARPHLEKAVTAAQRAAALTRQLLAYSGKAQLDWHPFNLNDLIRDNLHLLEAAAPKTVELYPELAAPLPLLEGDPGQLQQVIMNLVLNAAEAIGERPGRVTVRTAVCDLSEADCRAWRIGEELLEPGRFVRLEVEDNGSGMDAETLSKIFDPFFTTKFAGRGLGLAAVLGIVRGHKGGLRVTSTLGVGTWFQIIFPASAANSSAPVEPEPVQEIDMTRQTVLVIDDEYPVRDAVTDILALENVPVITAVDGETGIDLYRRRRSEVRLIILDLSMPGLSGEETFYELRKIDPQVHVLLSSGYSRDEVKQRFAGESGVGFIQKPYEATDLIDEVKRWLAM